MNEKHFDNYKKEIETLLIENESIENIYGLMIIMPQMEKDKRMCKFV